MTKIPFNGQFKISQPYGNKTNQFGYINGTHSGVDLVGLSSNKVYAVMDGGIVVYVGYEKNGFGNYIKILFNNMYFYFAHLKAVYVKKGDFVTYTTVIGLMGSTGNSTGAHTHVEIRKIDNKTRINPCEYMGIPNVRGIYNSSDYAIDKPIIKEQPKEEIHPTQEEIEKEKEEMKALEKCEVLEKELVELKKRIDSKEDKHVEKYDPSDWSCEAIEYMKAEEIYKGNGEKDDLNAPLTVERFLVFGYRIIKHITKWFVKKNGENRNDD